MILLPFKAIRYQSGLLNIRQKLPEHHLRCQGYFSVSQLCETVTTPYLAPSKIKKSCSKAPHPFRYFLRKSVSRKHIQFTKPRVKLQIKKRCFSTPLFFFSLMAGNRFFGFFVLVGQNGARFLVLVPFNRHQRLSQGVFQHFLRR